MSARRILDLALAIVFLGTIGCILVMTDWTSQNTWVAEREKRVPAPMPGLPTNWQTGSDYLANLFKFFDDHFGLRLQMIDLNGRIDIGILRHAPSPQVLVGKDGFLFYTGERSIEDYRHLDQYSPDELASWDAALRKRADWLAARGIRYLFVVAPNKNNVYPEELPSSIRREPGLSRVEQLRHRMGDPPYFLDLTQAMLMRKDQGLLFLKHDTHWTDLGAYIGYRAIMDRLGITPDPLIGSEPEHRVPVFVPDLSRLSGVTLGEPWLYRSPRCGQPKPTTTDAGIYGPSDYPAYTFAATECATGQGRLLIFHDSFVEAMIPFLSDTFQRVVYVRRIPNLAQMQAAVELEKPTVVIEERVERLLFLPAEK